MNNSYTLQALEYLSHAYDQERALFSYSSSIGEHGEVVNDFSHPMSLRYTINTYLGLREAERHGGRIGWLGYEVGAQVGRFLSLHERRIENCGDHGLLLVLLAAIEGLHPATARSLQRLELSVAREEAARRLNLQELAWMLWGLTAWPENPPARALAHRVFELIRTRFVHASSGMPRHSLKAYRAHTVSFGSVVYFLRAMHEYAESTGSREARALFTCCLERVLALQASDGAWPWMIDVRTGVPIDLYPVFSVHQDSMAMLFLFPAQRHGVAGINEAIDRSFMWNYGHNELGTSLVRSDPCAWFYRSIERDERWPRARRYLRGLGRAPHECPARSSRVRLNRECRSYHLGWVLYTWSGRPSAPLTHSPSVAIGPC